jgi:tRNA A-37 threonylcarbamoyl transferase component Bud32
MVNRQPDEAVSAENTMTQPQAEDESAGLQAERVAELAAFDEQLRQGGVALRTPGGDESSTAGAPPEELVECLQWIEEVWPRGRARAAASTGLPSFLGRFEIERVLGQGGFGIVYLARDPLLNRQVALKVPRLHALASEALRERFRREARATAALDHPHIVPIHETGDVGPLCYIACAYCEGPSLAQWLKLQAGEVPPGVAALIVRQLAEAMHYSHGRGVLHRDLKPSNVLLFPAQSDSGESGSLPFVPRVVDFGLARIAEEELEATGTSGVIGTPLYMAPEQALGTPEGVGPGADLYALGVILYELLCRQPPFVGTSPLEVLDQVRHADPPAIRKARPDVPRDLETICLKCLEKRPEERYGTAQELAEDLGRFLEGQDIAARPVGTVQRLVRWCEQPQRLREAGLAVIAINIAMGGWTFMTAMSIAWGLVPRPDHVSAADVYREILPIIFLTALPLIAAGVAIMRGQKWAIQISLGTGIGMTIVAILLALSLIANPYSWLFNDVPGFALLIYSMLAMLCFVQTLASVVAWMALRAGRRQKLMRAGGPWSAGGEH